MQLFKRKKLQLDWFPIILIQIFLFYINIFLFYKKNPKHTTTNPLFPHCIFLNP